MRRPIFCGFLLFSVFCFTACHRKQQKGTDFIRIDGRGSGRIFQGIGGVSAGASSRLLIDYPEPYRSQILDYLFKPNYGASLQHLKVEIGSDVNSTDGSEPSHMRTPEDQNYKRGYEWWLMEQARKRNPEIILDCLAWGAPAWIGHGHFFSQDMANYEVRFIQGGQKAHHLDIQYAGVWNEKKPEFSYVNLLKMDFQSAGLSTKLVCCDLYPAEDQWQMLDAMKNDATLRDSIDVVSVHYPRVKGKMTAPKAAKQMGKPLWSSEDGPWRGDWKGAEELAKIYNRNYIDGRMTATEIWSPVTSYYDVLPVPGSGLMYANTPWSGHYEVQPAIWATAQTTQFAQPGWRYIDSACGYLKGQGSFVTLRSPRSGDYSVIIETIDATQPQSVSFRVTGGLSGGMVHVWETNSTKMFGHVKDVTPQNGSFRMLLDPDAIYSLTTTTGQGKGEAKPPRARTFPLPYSENFERTEEGQAPRYFSDQDGAFEVWHCTGRSGRCLFQVIDKMPIPWDGTPDPYTLLGDVDWADYHVSADVLMEQPGHASVLGRIDSADNFKDAKALWPSAYILNVEQNGQWQLLNAKYKAPTTTLASGSASFPLNTWHHLGLSFKGSAITASIDGKIVARVSDTTHVHGMVAIGSGWNRAEFDNFQVQPERQ